MNQTVHPAAPRRLGAFLTIRILQMMIDNGVAIMTGRTKPHTVRAINRLRSLLLQDPFFDDTHRPEELRTIGRARSISFLPAVVLIARLLRVLARQSPLTQEQTEERITVRNECMIQPFFDRRLINSDRPFVDEEPEDDEACFVD